MTAMETTTNLCMELESIIRAYKNLSNSNCEEAFLRYLSGEKTLRSRWLETETECKELKEKLDSAVKDISVLENKLSLAERLVDQEKIRTEKIEKERDTLCEQLTALHRMLSRNHYSKSPENAKKEVTIFLELSATNYLDAESGKHSASDAVSKVPVVRLDNLNDDDGLALPIKSTPAKSSLFVEDLNGRTHVKTESQSIAREAITKSVRRENIENSSIVANSPVGTFTPNRYTSVNSPIVAKSPGMSTPSNRGNLSGHHNFIKRTFLLPESCTRCYRRIAFGRVVFKCTDCTIVIHPECRDDFLPPCKVYFSPSKVRPLASLSDYVHRVLPPYVPAFVLDCVTEIERRGLLEGNLYRMSGSEPLVRRLLEGVRWGKETKPNFINYDTHSICRALINFFENLKEPLIPRTYWKTFAAAETQSDLMLAVSALPRVNRDTLAFIVRHVQHVLLESDSSIEHLIEAFRSVIFGRECRELECAGTVIRELLLLPYRDRFETASSASLFTSTPSKCDFSPVTASTPSGRKRFFNNF